MNVTDEEIARLRHIHYDYVVHPGPNAQHICIPCSMGCDDQCELVDVAWPCPVIRLIDATS